FNELARDLAVPLDVTAPRRDSTESVVQAVIGEIDQIFAALPVRGDAFRRRADDGIAFTPQKRCDLFSAAAGNRCRSNSRNAESSQFFDDELHQRVIETTIAD